MKDSRTILFLSGLITKLRRVASKSGLCYVKVGEHRMSNRSRNIELVLPAKLTYASMRLYLIMSIFDEVQFLRLSFAKEDSLGV